MVCKIVRKVALLSGVTFRLNASSKNLATKRFIMSSTPQVLVNCHHHNAENPLWHPQHKQVYWTDIPNGRLFRYSPGFDGYEQIYLGEPVGGFTIQADGGLLLFKTRGTVEIWKGGETRTVVEEIPAARGTRFNDAIADPEGRVFSGTMATDGKPGRFYRIDTDGSVHELFDDMQVPNGMGFSLDYKHFYLTDSDQHVIFRCDYDRGTGALTNRVPFIETPKDDGVPDGMTVDTEGYIWSARWNGGAVYRYDTEGNEVLKIEMPTPKISCVAFGKEDYKTLLISSAREDQAIGLDNVAGDLFYAQTEVAGRAELRSRIGLG